MLVQSLIPGSWLSVLSGKQISKNKPCGTLNDKCPIVSGIWVLGPQLVVLFGLVWEVCPYWIEGVLGTGFQSLKSKHS